MADWEKDRKNSRRPLGAQGRFLHWALQSRPSRYSYAPYQSAVERSPPMTRHAPALAATGSTLAIGTALVAVGLIAGCQAPAAPFDPFLAGRNTIPPPGTAVPAASAPYYNAAPPTVTVPAPGATYTAPGAIPAAPPPTSLPPAGAGQLPRGISVPQSNYQTRGDSSQLAKWQPSEDAKTAARQFATSPTANSSETTGKASDVELASASDAPKTSRDGGVVRASHEEQSREPPIRIVEPATNASAATTSDDDLFARSARKKAASTSLGKAAPSRKLPELTDFPAADTGFKPNTRP
jgi:hypothetical protein